MSADVSRDRLALTADHLAIQADGTDTTRVTFRAVDSHGNQRPHVTGDLSLSLTGPGQLAGDNPFPLGIYGGVGGAFIRSIPGRTGTVTVTASHARLGSSTIRVMTTPVAPSRRFAP
jgi:beta-galactosidase